MFTEPSPRYGEPGYFGERLGRYLERRAAADVGTIIAGTGARPPDDRVPDAQQRDRLGRGGDPAPRAG
jgi:2,4-dienoyl-CoA reductase-like NADH-dependent reductase (Old Yellow Enzyme family)